MPTRAQKNPNKKRRGIPRFFYLGDKLYYRQHVDRGRELVEAWCCTDEREVLLSYLDVVYNHERTWTTSEVEKIVNRGRIVLWRALREGGYEDPQRSWRPGHTRPKHSATIRWSKKDIMNVRDYLANRSEYKWRKDSRTIPSKREVRAMLDDEQLMYVKDGDEYVPTFKAKRI